MRKLFLVILALVLLLATCNLVPAGEQGNVVNATWNAAILCAQNTLPVFIQL